MTCPRNLVARVDWDETDWNDHFEEELASTARTDDGPMAAAAHTDDGSARRVCFPYRYIVFFIPACSLHIIACRYIVT